MLNPFQPATPVAKKLKICLFGPSGSGKTLAALSFPRVALIDAESGSDLYAGRPGVPAFHRVRAKTLSEVEQAVNFIQQDAGKTFDTLIIDPISVLYDVEKNVASANNTKDMNPRDWNKINGRLAALYTKLTTLNVHVIIIARETTEYAGEGLNLKKVGVKPDADKKLVYMMDFVVRLNADHSGQVEKSRGIVLGSGGALAKVEWSAFEAASNAFVDGKKQDYEDDEQAAERETDSLQNKENAVAFCKKWNAEAITNDVILKALDVERISEWTKGSKAADEAVNAYIDTQVAKPATPKANGKPEEEGAPLPY